MALLLRRRLRPFLTATRAGLGSYTKTDVTIPGLRTHQVLISRRIERAIGVCSNPRAAFIMDLAVGATYELLALAVHCGQMAAGHYTTYKRLLRAGAAANAGYDDKYAWKMQKV